MTTQEIVLVGRSSSHFTRTARLFALELGVPHAFRPVLDMTTLDPTAYADNPALKVPVLVDEQGPLYGTENICRALAERSGKRERVVLRGDVGDRTLANAEELVLHAMSSEVTIITSTVAGATLTVPPKVGRSLDNALAQLERTVDQARASLPPGRLLSFFEASLFCLITHLPFRQIRDVSALSRLQSFGHEFEQRDGARATSYRFDRP